MPYLCVYYHAVYWSMDSTGAEQQAGRVVLQPHFKENEKKNNEGTMYSGNHRGVFFFFPKRVDDLRGKYKTLIYRKDCV